MNQEKEVRGLLKVKKNGYLYHRESQTLEFKEQFNLAGLDDYFRDFVAFANNRGGYLIFGVADNPYKLVGLSENSKKSFNTVDPEKITGFLLEIFSLEINWVSGMIKHNDLYFAYFYISESKIKPIIAKKDEGKNNVIQNGNIYYRYGGRTQRIQFGELESIISQWLKQQNQEWQKLITSVAKSSPENVSILDTKRGVIDAGDNKLLIDESMLNKIKFIKDGEFTEKKGSETLRLVGDVKEIGKVEAVKIEKQRLTDQYPFSALELVEEIKKKNPSISQNLIWEIIKENDIKNTAIYSAYNFRNKKQEKRYTEKDVLPKAIPSIYNKKAVDFIIKIIKSENI